MQPSQSQSVRKALRIVLQLGAVVHLVLLVTILAAVSLVGRGYQLATKQQEFRSAIDKQLSAQQLETSDDLQPVYDPSTKVNQAALELLTYVEQANYERAREQLRARRVVAPRSAPQTLTTISEFLTRSQDAPLTEADQKALAQAVREFIFEQNKRPAPRLLARVYTFIVPQLARFNISLPPLLMSPI